MNKRCKAEVFIGWRIFMSDAMCHCMSDEEYEAMLKRIREAQKKTVERPALITVKA